MEKYTLEKDVKVFCVTAKSFPEGIMEAHQKLHSLVPFSDERRYFGISRPEQEEDGKIVYKAAAEELEPGEKEKYNCEPFIIKRGQYISQTVKDYMKAPQNIGLTFQELTSSPDIDPNGYCVEWYLDQNDVRCMVRLDQ